MSRVALGLYLLALSSCGTTELQHKEATIQTALAGAFLACQAALNDPRLEWEPGARDYCLRVINATPECVLP